LDDLPNSKVQLGQDYQGKPKNSNIALKLHEVGPRMQLELVKIQEGLCAGNVVFHAYVNKSKKEIQQTFTSIKKKREIKE
jgi:ribosome biogenesis protein SSF1/2